MSCETRAFTNSASHNISPNAVALFYKTVILLTNLIVLDIFTVTMLCTHPSVHLNIQNMFVVNHLVMINYKVGLHEQITLC